MAAGAGTNDRRVTLHMGVQKTASTALHHLLQRNADMLADQLLVRTPVRGTAAQRMGRAAINFSLDTSAENEAALVGWIKALRDEIDASTLPVLISHENLPGAMLGLGGVTTLYPEIERIIALIDEHLAPYEPRFAFYTRDMAAWKKSVYNQAVKTDGYAGSFETFLAETTDCGSWAELEARIAAAVGTDRVAFFALESETDPMRPGQQLLGFAGLAPAVIARLDPISWRANESLNPGALEFMRLVNRTGFGRKPRMKIMTLVMANQALFAPGLPDGGPQ